MSPLVTRMNMRCALASLLCLALLQCGEDPPAKPVTPQSASCEALGLQNGQPFVSAGGDDTNMDIFNIVYETNGMRIWYEYRSASVNTGNVVTGKVYNLAFDSKMSVTSYDATLNGVYCHYGPPGPTNPEPVILYQPTEVSSDWARLQWSKNNDADFARYEVYRGDYENFPPSEGEKVATVSDQNTCEAILKGLSRETNYRYKVLVVDKEGLTTPSNEVTLTTGEYKTYGTAHDDYAVVICRGFDGGFLIAGHTQSHRGLQGVSDLDCYFLKIDDNGFEKWDTTFSVPEYDEYPTVMKRVGEDKIALAYCSQLGNTRKAYLSLLTKNLTVIWTKSYDSLSDIRSIVISPDGDFVLGGNYEGVHPTIVSTDGMGNEKWRVVYRKDEFSHSLGFGYWLSDMVLHPDNTIIAVLGSTSGDLAYICGMSFTQIDLRGHVKWTKDVAVHSYGSMRLMAAGYTRLMITAYDPESVVVWRYSIEGSRVWDISFHGKFPGLIANMESGNYFVAVKNYGGYLGFHSVDGNGSINWSSQTPELFPGEIAAIERDDMGNFVIVGNMGVPNRGRDIVVMKVNQQGHFLSKRFTQK